MVYWYPLIGYTLVCSWTQFVSPKHRLLRYYEPEDRKMFSKCSFAAPSQAPTFSRRHTKTHTENNRCHSERDCHRSTTTTLIYRHQTILRLLSSAAAASTRWRVRELNCSTTYAAVKPTVPVLSVLRSVTANVLPTLYCCILSRLGT